MMGSAHASGLDRASIAAERAVSSPLLEDVNLSGARGVLVNITANASIKLKEIHDAMNTIKAFAAEDATVIVGQVIDENMGEDLRVTIVATGLGAPVSRQLSKPLAVVKTGTDDMPIASAEVNYSELEQPAVMRRRRTEQVEALKQSGMEMYDIPAFLRKQAD
jgi:cell division protein FtsZ